MLFSQDLCPRLTAELGEDVKDILSLLLRPLAINYGAILYDAMKVIEPFVMHAWRVRIKGIGCNA